MRARTFHFGPLAFVVGLAAAVAFFGAPRAAAALPRAETPTAAEQAAFDEGLRLLRAKEGRGAERAFKAGYAVAHDPAFLIRVGEAQEAAGAPREAAESYARYLRESPDASDRDDIEQRLARLAPAPATPKQLPEDRDVPSDLPGAGVAAPSAPPAPAQTIEPPAATPTPPAGDHAVGAPRSVSHAPAQAHAQAHDDEELRALVDENTPPRTRLNTAGWIGSGVTTLLLGVAAFYGAKASEKNGDVNRLLGNFNERTGVPVEYATVANQYEADVREGKRDDRLAKGFAIAAGATAVASLVLFVVDAARASDAPTETVHARLRRTRPSTRDGLRLAWTF